jgi:hypothetical protein
MCDAPPGVQQVAPRLREGLALAAVGMLGAGLVKVGGYRCMRDKSVIVYRWRSIRACLGRRSAQGKPACTPFIVRSHAIERPTHPF